MTHEIGFYLSSPTAKMPSRANPSDAGWDLYSAEKYTFGIYPGGVHVERTGVHIHWPPSRTVCGMVCSRSGLATRGIVVANAPGIIDPGYTGQICVILANVGSDAVRIQPGDRIAQLVFAPVLDVRVSQVDTPPAETDRGGRGLGSSGR